MRLFIAIFSLVFWAVTPSDLQAQTSADVTTLTVKVSGVGCASDLRSISEKVKEVEGVTACEVEKRGATTRFLVSYNPEFASTDDIYTAIEDTPGCKNPNDRPYRVKL